MENKLVLSSNVPDHIHEEVNQLAEQLVAVLANKLIGKSPIVGSAALNSAYTICMLSIHQPDDLASFSELTAEQVRRNLLMIGSKSEE